MTEREGLRDALKAHRPCGTDLVGWFGTCSCGAGGECVDFETVDEWIDHVFEQAALAGAGPASNEGVSLPELTEHEVACSYQHAPNWKSVSDSLNWKLAKRALAGKDAHSLYASYANHEAIAKRVPLTFHSWKREQGKGFELGSAGVCAPKADAKDGADKTGSCREQSVAGPAVLNHAPARYHLREHIFDDFSLMGSLWHWSDKTWRCKCGVALGGDNLFEAWMQHLEGA